MKKDRKKFITIEKASEHNLKDIDVSVPKDKFTIVTGVSGSGKSSLAFDTIFKEGQRLYLRTFAGYSGRLMNKTSKPSAARISGMIPTIALDQKTTTGNIRSTVGTLSEIYDLLRLLYARTGLIPECYSGPSVDRSLFSFNSPKGACPVCKGLGVQDIIDPALLIADPTRTVRNGAFVMTTPSGYIVYSQVTMDVLDSVCNAHGFSVDIPWQDMTEEQKHIILRGSDKIKVPFGKHTLESRLKWSGITAKPREEGYYPGIINIMEDILKRDRNGNILRFARSVPCSSCKGARLNNNALSITVNNKNIAELSTMTLNTLSAFLQSLSGNNTNRAAEPIINEILVRIGVLSQLGLDYLTPDRTSITLSAGEAQRIRLAVQTTGNLRNILYVLDEPSVGLHPKHNLALLESLKSLKNKGNSLLVVEHDEDFIKNSEWLIDIGPEAGTQGGNLLYSGKTEDFRGKVIPESQTWKYVSKEQDFSQLSVNRSGNGKSLIIRGAAENNLKNIDAEFKLGCINVVCGVSGAGKSTLTEMITARFLRNKLHKSKDIPGKFASIEGWDNLDKVIDIDQSPIGKTPRSNPATYTKLFDHIRAVYASQPLAAERGYKKNRFSFNVKGGRCEACEGAGIQEIGMHFSGNVSYTCPVCNGKRFNSDTLDVTYKGKSIFDVLEMTIDEAALFLSDNKKITHILGTLQSTGLGYLTLGQPSTTLSGGEAQRVKLSSELCKPDTGSTIYILDEPTTGLHTYDVKVLLNAIHKLADKGNTVIIIEHNPYIVFSADHVIELGPGSGPQGGNTIFSGTPVNMLKSHDSVYTEFTKSCLNQVDFSGEELSEAIELVNVSTNNLKNISVKIPHNSLTVLTGVSGSGKSSLLFDTIYAEGHRCFTESMSTYARRFLKNMAKPDAESITGLSPCMAIKQSAEYSNPRSTVGTFSGIYDILRLMFARAGRKNGELESKGTLSSIFSFNDEKGACTYCKGLGIIKLPDPYKIVTDPDKSLIDGAMDGSKSGKFYGDTYGQYVAALLQVGTEHNIDYTIPWSELCENARNIAMYGTGNREYEVVWKYKRKKREGEHIMKVPWLGFTGYIAEEYERKHQDKRGDAMLSLFSESVCENCCGSGLKPEGLSYKINGSSIYDLASLSITELNRQLIEMRDKETAFNPKENAVIEALVPEMTEKLKTISEVGVGYLSLSRKINTLSGGEFQRLRIAVQTNSDLSGITYILDEPTKGLHPADTQKLISTLKRLRDKGNTVLVSEHDRDVIENADRIIELGPDAGLNGGTLIANCNVNELTLNPDSKTGKYLNKSQRICVERKHSDDIALEIRGAKANNLKNINTDIPRGLITVVTGVSGSGKSSLIGDVIHESYCTGKTRNADSVTGFESFDEVIMSDQKQPAKASNSVPATFIGVFDHIRKLFAQTHDAVKAGYKATHFSYANKLGQCPECKGSGSMKVSMDFLADVHLECELCHGKRYKDEILKVTLNGKSIHDVLEMSVDNALYFFGDQKKIMPYLSILEEIGLGYIKLGQPLNTLSGGEIQRLKLCRNLLTNKKGNKLYLLDEPTTGLHFEDTERLLTLLEKLRSAGNTIVIIEHNTDVIRNADFVIDLGPGGGSNGGYIIARGTPEEVSDNPVSVTGKYI